MKDQIQLLVVAVLAALASWAFWHYLGEASFTVFSTIAILVLAGDNMRLRRKLKANQQN